MKKFLSVMFLAAIILLTSAICFAARSDFQNGYWKGNPNYPLISSQSYTVAVKNTAQKNYLLQPSNERVTKIETAVVSGYDDLDSDAFFYKKFGNYIFFSTHNTGVGLPVINWKLLNKNNPEHQEAWRAYQIAAEVLRLR